MEKYKEHIAELKILNDFLDKSDFQYSEYFHKMLTSQIIDIEYLDQFNQAYFENHTYSFAVNLYL